MKTYPYLRTYLSERLGGLEVLEIGLGYGTLSSALVARGANYYGADIAEGPVEMSRHGLGGRPSAGLEWAVDAALNVSARRRWTRIGQWATLAILGWVMLFIHPVTSRMRRTLRLSGENAVLE